MLVPVNITHNQVKEGALSGGEVEPGADRLKNINKPVMAHPGSRTNSRPVHFYLESTNSTTDELFHLRSGRPYWSRVKFIFLLT
ncbi:hypothetical protein J6590_093898, partial [Homalodisca vitripennis]